MSNNMLKCLDLVAIFLFGFDFLKWHILTFVTRLYNGWRFLSRGLRHAVTSKIKKKTTVFAAHLHRQKEDSIDKAIKATVQRRDEEERARFASHDANPEIHWHSTCYASYTSDQNIRYTTPSDALQRTNCQKEVDVISSGTRSAMAPVDWFRCFICKNNTHKKSRDQFRHI